MTKNGISRRSFIAAAGMAAAALAADCYGFTLAPLTFEPSDFCNNGVDCPPGIPRKIQEMRLNRR